MEKGEVSGDRASGAFSDELLQARTALMSFARSRKTIGSMLLSFRSESCLRKYYCAHSHSSLRAKSSASLALPGTISDLLILFSLLDLRQGNYQ